METLSYVKSRKALFARLGAGRKMVLATSAGGRVTARTMSFVVRGGMLYFQTDTDMLKARQLAVNPQAAVCWENIQIEGGCESMGHPNLPENAFFAEAYRELYPASYEKYTGLPREQLYRLKPESARLWCYDKDGNPFTEHIDFVGGEAYQERYPLDK